MLISYPGWLGQGRAFAASFRPARRALQSRAQAAVLPPITLMKPSVNVCSRKLIDVLGIGHENATLPQGLSINESVNSFSVSL